MCRGRYNCTHLHQLTLPRKICPTTTCTCTQRPLHKLKNRFLIVWRRSGGCFVASQLTSKFYWRINFSASHELLTKIVTRFPDNLKIMLIHHFLQLLIEKQFQEFHDKVKLVTTITLLSLQHEQSKVSPIYNHIKKTWFMKRKRESSLSQAALAVWQWVTSDPSNAFTKTGLYQTSLPHFCIKSCTRLSNVRSPNLRWWWWWCVVVYLILVSLLTPKITDKKSLFSNNTNDVKVWTVEFNLFSCNNQAQDLARVFEWSLRLL